MEFRIARDARDRYHLGEGTFGDRSTASDLAAARLAAWRIAEGGGARPERPVTGGDVAAMALIHELQHRAIDRAARVVDMPGTTHDPDVAAFEAAFPSAPVYLEDVPPVTFLRDRTATQDNRVLSTEELLLLWVANRNPAFMRYGELFDETPLVEGSGYHRVIELLRARSAEDADATGGEDLVERLLEPARQVPESLTAQLHWIADHWPDVVDDDVRVLLTRVVDVLAEEEVAARRAWERHAGGGGDVQPAALHGFSAGGDEPESFSPDRDWMPDLVLMAKSSYVWLDQLSRAYGRPIRTLDAIPDEELDRLRSWGFTGLWLIGLWERSHASQRIKQLRGNPEAVASAYSLMDYRIADDLGGDAAWQDLRDRAWARGIRLASDMVPNHMGIDSRWVMDHPDWFIGRDDPPYPSYSWTGDNLSSDERVGIYLEDHYLDDSDAAVVFKRVDRWSGATRYIYHGNDGTSIPWNDTAQLDFLRAEVREQVIRTILDVARRFPVIRFDAAMVLARKHVQRLWYPLPGGGGAIPSRAESALTQAQLDALMPGEFWREVVDRVAAEAPDTLLLAEAFWLLEGYFVRTLGMHRVYNSAFMHMLRDEDNAGYRSVIRETVGFDARILGRYVNFMNNPDERTAVDQFGAGDKYLGVATMLATLPGLPMFGHGQVEGFGEKYGMEFRRAMLQEVPDAGLVARHEAVIFPLLRERWRFAGADGFRLLDALRGDASVDEDVFAYTNERFGARSLVVYRNRYAEGRVRVTGVGDALGVPGDPSAWVILRDARTGLEHLRNGRDLHTQGLELDLRAYQCHVFLDPEVVYDDAAGDWARLAWRIGLEGVPDLRAALREQLLEPTRLAVDGLFRADTIRDVAGAAMARGDAAADTLVAQAADGLVGPLGTVAQAVGATAGRGASLSTVHDRITDRFRTLVAVSRAARSRPSGRGAATTAGSSEPIELTVAQGVGTWLGRHRERWAVLVGWSVAAGLGDLVQASTPEASVGVFDAWGAGGAIARTARELGLDGEVADRVALIVRALVASPAGTSARLDASSDELAAWLEIPAVAVASGRNEWQGEVYVVQEALAPLLEALAARDAVLRAGSTFEDVARILDRVRDDGFRIRERGTTPTPA
ncbi:MAG: alpha-amylase [Chloroflexi bacterium]|nr:alpha-amylase [Chloroflexota bacterium]